MFTREWCETELTQLIITLHQAEGMISMLRQMLAALDNESPAITLDELEAMLPEGTRIEREAPNED